MAQNYCLSQCFRAHAHSYCWRRLLALKPESIALASVLVARKYCSCQSACLPLRWIGSSASWVSLTFLTQSRARQLENSSAWLCRCHFPLVCSKDGMVAFHCCSWSSLSGFGINIVILIVLVWELQSVWLWTGDGFLHQLFLIGNSSKCTFYSAKSSKHHKSSEKII